MSPKDKLLIWFVGEVKTPPFSSEARIEAGYLLRLLQKGESLSMPQSRPMPNIAKGCHELRISDESKTWRIIYRIYEDAIVVVDVFAKKTNKTPSAVIQRCQKRLKQYDSI
jgi:phage-related protein